MTSHSSSSIIAGIRGWVGCLALLLVAMPGQAQEPALGQEGQIWNLGTQVSGRTFPTTVSAFNHSCSGKRSFRISVLGQAARFLKITGPTLLEGIKLGETKTSEALLDLRGIEPGVYNEGTIEVRCTNCPPKCRQDYQVIFVHLTVVAPAMASGTETAAAVNRGPEVTGESGSKASPPKTESGDGSAPSDGDGETTRGGAPQSAAPPGSGSIELGSPPDGSTVTKPEMTFTWTPGSDLSVDLQYRFKVTSIPEGKTPQEAMEEEPALIDYGVIGTKYDASLWALGVGSYAWRIETLEEVPTEDEAGTGAEESFSELGSDLGVRFSSTWSFKYSPTLPWTYGQGSTTTSTSPEEGGDDPRDTPPPTVYGEELCGISDVEGRFEPAQGVWQDDPVFADKPGKQLTQVSPQVLRAELPMVKDRKTLLFGTIRPVGAQPEDQRDWIYMRGKSGGSVQVPVRFRFTLKQSGVSQEIYRTPVIGMAPVGGPCATGSESFEVKIEADRGIPPFGAGFTFPASGDYIVEAELITGDGRPTGMKIAVLGSVVETRGPSIAFRPIFLHDIDVAGMRGLGKTARELASKVSQAIPDYYPVPSAALPVSVHPVLNMRHRIGGYVTDLAIFQSDRESAIREQLTRELNAGGLMASADRVVVLLLEKDFELLRADAAGFAPAQKVVYVDVETAAYDETVAHELAHTMPYLFSGEEMQAECDRNYHNQSDGIAHGHRVTWDLADIRSREDGEDPIMGPVSPVAWITQCTYRYLAEVLQDGPPDPPVILVQGFVSRRDGEAKGLLMPLYQLDGIVDLEQAEVGSWAIVLRDGRGASLGRFPFAPEWRIADLELERDLMSFVYRVPDLPGVAAVDLLGPSGLLDSKSYSDHAPTVAISSPVEEELVTPVDGSVRITWAAEDADGDRLLSTLLYSADDGKTWAALAFEIEEGGFDLPVDPDTLSHQVIVRVTDGSRSTDALLRFRTRGAGE